MKVKIKVTYKTKSKTDEKLDKYTRKDAVFVALCEIARQWIY